MIMGCLGIGFWGFRFPQWCCWGFSYCLLLFYYYYYLLQLSFLSVAVVLTLVTNKNKYTLRKQYKNTVNTSTHITKTPTYDKTHTYTHPPLTKLIHKHTHILQNPHIHTPTHYKTHTHTHPHITKPTHSHTHTYTHPHITEPTDTQTHTLQNP